MWFKPHLGGGFEDVLFSPLFFGEMIQFDYLILIFFKRVETTN